MSYASEIEINRFLHALNNSFDRMRNGISLLQLISLSSNISALIHETKVHVLQREFPK
jgi:hypothetical protein